MIDTPISKKRTNYPLDFIPSNNHKNTQKRFSINQNYKIDSKVINKYQDSIDILSNNDQHNHHHSNIVKCQNIEKNNFKQIIDQEEERLLQHIKSKKPNLTEDLLKKPRFSVNHNSQIQENNEQIIQNSTSPGAIKKQLQNRQQPLPLQDPCKIELFKSSKTQLNKIPNNYIKYRSSSQLQTKKWKSPQIQIIEKIKNKTFNDSLTELTLKQKTNPQKLYMSNKEGIKINENKLNSFLSNIKGKQAIRIHNTPVFDSRLADQIKRQINDVIKSKKQIVHNNFQNKQYSQQKQQSQKSIVYNTNQQKGPQLIVSYRSSISYLKDLYIKTKKIQNYTLIVKIPKLFTQNLIYPRQERQSLYQVAEIIFQQLNIQHQNLVIKRYTNCTIIISRNICLIWYFDGKRYLGGWQTQYLDQGVKHGVGLQWSPKQYVYYGQFVKNKRQGLGVYKHKDNRTYIGNWLRGVQQQNEQQYQDNDYQRYEEEDFGPNSRFQYI